MIKSIKNSNLFQSKRINWTKRSILVSAIPKNQIPKNFDKKLFELEKIINFILRFRTKFTQDLSKSRKGRLKKFPKNVEDVPPFEEPTIPTSVEAPPLNPESTKMPKPGIPLENYPETNEEVKG